MGPRKTLAPLVVLSLLAGCGDDAQSTDGAGGGVTSTTGNGPGGTTGPGGPSTTGSSPTTSTTGSGGAPPSCSFTETPGTTNETLDVGGTERTYVLVVPDSVDGTTPVPLIFGFHGFGGTGESASQYFGLSGEDAYYVFPQALELPEGGVGWDMEADGVDVAFIDALITSLSANHCIDPARVFAAGHSHGASFSNHLGCYRPEVFRAIAPVAGGGPWAGECTGSVSAMLSHGTADQDVPIENGEGSRDHWLEANGCAGSASSPTQPAPCVAYDGCAEPVLWCQHDGGHEWPEFAGSGIREFFLSF